MYAGNVLSDEKANEVGKTQGDEYFADLDFALQASHKEGYESQAEDSGDESKDTKKLNIRNVSPITVDLSSSDEGDGSMSPCRKRP